MSFLTQGLPSSLAGRVTALVSTGVVGLLSAGFVVWAAVIGGLAAAMAERRCDDSCNDALGPIASGLDWTYFRSSWQWSVLGIMAAVSLFAAAGLVLALIFRRKRAAWVLYALQVIAAVTIVYLRSTAGPLDAEPPRFAVVAGELAGFVAIWLRAGRPAPGASASTSKSG